MGPRVIEGDLKHSWVHERASVLHSQNLPLPLRLWTSIKPFITPRSNFSIFPALQAPTTSADQEHWVNSAFHAHVRGCHFQALRLTFSTALSHFITYFFFFFFVTLLLLITQTLPPASVCDLTRLISSYSPVAPTIHEIKSHGIGLGRTALLRCEAAAVPSPTFEWYKGEKRWGCLDRLSFQRSRACAASLHCPHDAALHKEDVAH